MENLEPLKIGKYTFGVSFAIGNIFLFGYLLAKIEMFAIYGYFYLFVAAAINILIVLFLIGYGIVFSKKIKDCLKAIGIILLNIPLAVLYAWIGLSI